MATSRETLAIHLTLTGATVAGAALRTVAGAIGGIGRVLGSANSGLFFLTSNLSAAARAGRALSSSLLVPNIDFETATLQFETLLGSADAADRRIRELFDYARSTPFTNQQVLSGGRLLELYGEAALGAGQGLRMVGDMASAVAADFAEVAGWTGRAYDAIQSGRPWGEAAQRLSELGILSGSARARLEAMTEAGADGSTVWRAFQQEMSRFDGAAARLGETFAGVTSTISGQWTEIRRVLGEGLFDQASAGMKGLRDSIQEAFDNHAISRFSYVLDQLASNTFGDILKLPDDVTVTRVAQRLTEIAFDLNYAIEKQGLGNTLLKSFQSIGPQLVDWLETAAYNAGSMFFKGVVNGAMPALAGSNIPGVRDLGVTASVFRSGSQGMGATVRNLLRSASAGLQSDTPVFPRAHTRESPESALRRASESLERAALKNEETARSIASRFEAGAQM